MASRFLVAAAALLATACGAHSRGFGAVAWPDTPVELRDAADRELAIDRMWALPPGSARDAARDAIADALARHLGDAIADDQPFAAAARLAELASLWSDDPARVGASLAAHVDVLRRARAMFAKSGALEATATALVVLAEAEPAQRAARIAELDEIIAFADDLATADSGPDAARAQPLALLQPTALALPLPWVVDRYVELAVARQQAVAAIVDQRGASLEVIRAHRDALESARRIANVLARAGRSGEIAARIGPMKGLGSDAALAARAAAIVGSAQPIAFADLATALRTADHAADPAAALAVERAGLAKFERDPPLLAGAADDARTIGRIDDAIARYQAALAAAPELDPAIALRLGRVYSERIERLARLGRPTAATAAWNEALDYAVRASHAHPDPVWQQTAALAESGLGRGFASQGLLSAARYALLDSLERAPSIDAYETLASIDVQTGDYVESQQWADLGIRTLGEETKGDRYRRAKLERIAGDALRRAGKPRDAAARYLECLRGWASLGDPKALPKAIVAERLLDSARAMWWLGDPQHATELLLGAAELGAESPAAPGAAVAFLVEIGRYREAVDAYHRGVGEPGIGELDKVAMSLWIASEARRQGAPPDRIATEYLASRRGDVWYDLLAQAASGKVDRARLDAAATTGPRRAQLAFYGAALGFDPAAATDAGKQQLLEQSLRAGLVLSTEYDLARAYLGGS